MYKHVKEHFSNSLNPRLLILYIIFITMGIILSYRIFTLQIINGETYLNNFTLKIQKEKSISSTRGKIYDCNGKLLAYNELAYTVTIEDVYESGNSKNKELNSTILNLIHMIEDNGDKIVNDFNIIIDTDGNYAFTVEGTKLKRFLADVYGHISVDDLLYSEETATAKDVVEYLGGYAKYGIGDSTDLANPRDSFVYGQGYSPKEILKIITIRYAMSANSFQKYIPTTVATAVNDKTVATVMENASSLEGVAIAEDTIRKYENSTYFSQIIGYTGKISEEEYTAFNATMKAQGATTDSYALTDTVGKAGIEQTMETDLQGVKGSETVYVNNLGKVIETTNRVEPVAGNDLYLTIDSDLQIAIYHILEQKLAGILVAKIKNIKEYVPGENANASSIIIPINDVYYALINNSVININHFEESSSGENEKAVQAAFLGKKASVFAKLKEELSNVKTPYQALETEYQVYESYIVTMLTENGVLMNSKIDTEDATYIAWKTDETISLAEFLNYCIAQNWIDVTKITLDTKYSDSVEIYNQLQNYIFEKLDNNTNFSKRLYKYMIKEDLITGKQICNILLEQNVISITEAEKDAFVSGKVAPFTFMVSLIENLYITPAQLALDPYSASMVVTDIKTGEVKALVSYPSYDNNRLANSIDADYYASLQSDLSKPMWNYATQQKTAPGSTFKMVSATAGLEEGVITLDSTITCRGIFDRFATSIYKCWIYPSAHGALNVTGAIANSCNSFFYEVGYQLGVVNDTYNSDVGIKMLAKYADLYGLSEKSGVEIEESIPEISDDYSVLSAIGQGTNNFTTVGLARYVTAVANSGTCYDLSLIDQLTDSNGNLLKDYTPEVRNIINLPSSTWNAIHSGMRQVVEKKDYYTDLGVDVAGKTGTAQENKSRANHALFVSYAPYEAPEIAIATRIAYGYTSDYAAEMTREVYKYYFGLEEEDNILTGTAELPEAAGNGLD